MGRWDNGEESLRDERWEEGGVRRGQEESGGMKTVGC